MFKTAVMRIDRNRKRLRPIGILITAFLGALLALYILGPGSYTIEGLTFSVSSELARTGSTTLDLSPLGSVSALTHKTPLAVNIQLTYIGTGAADILGEDTASAADTLGNVYNGLMNTVTPFFIRQIIIVFLGAFLAVQLLWRSRLTSAFIAGFTCAAVMVLLLFFTYQSYDIEAFKEPVYCGIIALAPQLIPEPGEFADKLEEVQEDTRKVVNNMKILMSSANGLSYFSSPIEDESFKKVLLVSDLHSNPLGVEFIDEVATNFNVDLILDAGDMTDLGTSIEAELAAEISSFAAPYVFCPGNHDTPEIMDFVNNLDNATVLSGNMINIAGVSILGSADPLAYGAEIELSDPLEEQALMIEQAEALIDTASASELEPEIVVVHNPQAAEAMTGNFPLVVYGHTHQQSITIEDNTIFLNPGTSGAAGIRGLYADDAIPYSAMILYLSADGTAAAVDTVKYEPFSDRFFIERKLLHPQLRKQQVVIDEESLAEDYVEEQQLPTEQ